MNLPQVIQQIEQALEAGPTAGKWHAPGLFEVHAEDCGILADTGPANNEDEARLSVRQCNANAAFIAACNPQSIRILLDALDEAQRDSKRYQWLRQGLKVRGNHPEHDSVWVVRYDAPKGAIPAMCGAGFGADLDAAIDKAMEQPK